MKNQFRIQVKETGEVLRYYHTLAFAKLVLEQHNQNVPNKYEIAELTLDGTYTPVES
jgi:hypothetical protein